MGTAVRAALVERLQRQLSGVEIPDDLVDEIMIDTSDLPGALQVQPVLYARYALAHAEALAQYEVAKQDVDQTAAAAESYVRLTGKVTDKAAEAAVKQSESYQTAVLARSDAYEAVQLLGALKAIFEQRAQMLTMLAAASRKEYDQTR